jgi:hypothetical protein
MKMRKMACWALFVASVFGITLFYPSASAAQSAESLSAGTYVANVKAIVCSGCAPLIKETMENTKMIDSVLVDSKASTVQFQVKKDKIVKVSDLQKALNAAASKMGMGADYTLKNIKTKK